MAIPRCSLCPRSCRVPRADDAPSAGVCGMPAMPVVARAALHVGEEPCISGTRGSGTVFFSGCSLGCVFCQNHPISHERFGETVSIRRLAEIFWELEAQGAHNINLVNPTHYAAAIRQALRLYRPAIPVVYNSSGYERVETLPGAGGAGRHLSAGFEIRTRRTGSGLFGRVRLFLPRGGGHPGNGAADGADGFERTGGGGKGHHGAASSAAGVYPGIPGGIGLAGGTQGSGMGQPAVPVHPGAADGGVSFLEPNADGPGTPEGMGLYAGEGNHRRLCTGARLQRNRVYSRF